jgi:hypothetical protein
VAPAKVSLLRLSLSLSSSVFSSFLLTYDFLSPSGFECFDWASKAWISLDIAPGTAVVFAGELFR